MHGRRPSCWSLSSIDGVHVNQARRALARLQVSMPKLPTRRASIPCMSDPHDWPVSHADNAGSSAQQQSCRWRRAVLSSPPCLPLPPPGPAIISDIRRMPTTTPPHACQTAKEGERAIKKPRHPATNGEQKGNPEASVARLAPNPGPS